MMKPWHQNAMRKVFATSITSQGRRRIQHTLTIMRTRGASGALTHISQDASIISLEKQIFDLQTQIVFKDK